MQSVHLWGFRGGVSEYYILVECKASLNVLTSWRKIFGIPGNWKFCTVTGYHRQAHFASLKPQDDTNIRIVSTQSDCVCVCVCVYIYTHIIHHTQTMVGQKNNINWTPVNATCHGIFPCVIFGTSTIGLQPRSKDVKAHTVIPTMHQNREFECQSMDEGLSVIPFATDCSLV